MLTWKEAAFSEPTSESQALAHYQIIRRNAAVVPFEPNKIAHAMMRAFMAVHGVYAFARSICSGWLHGFWRALKPSKLGARSGDRAACLIAQFAWSHGKANRGCKDFSVAANPICATHLKRVSKTQSP